MIYILVFITCHGVTRSTYLVLEVCCLAQTKVHWFDCRWGLQNPLLASGKEAYGDIIVEKMDCIMCKNKWVPTALRKLKKDTNALHYRGAFPNKSFHS